MNTVDLLLALLERKSITPDDGGILEFIASYLDEYEPIWCNQNGVKNLFLTRKFQDEGIHFCFAGHVDVVPPGDGWDTDPFVPRVEDGVIYARGAQDMKSGVAAMTTALKQASDFQGRLSLLLTSDEEGDAVDGTQAVLEHLRDINLLPDYSIVAEPTCEVKFGDAIKVGRRGSVNGTVWIEGRQGHVAYPEKSLNPVDILAPRLSLLSGAKLDSGDEVFAPSQIVVTDIRGGMEVTNVTPSSVKLMFNIRNSTKTTIEDIRLYIEDIFDNTQFRLELKQSAFPFVTKSDSLIASTLIDSINSLCHVVPKCSTAGGTSDARFIANYGIEVVEFGVKNDRIHGANECVAIEDVEALHGVFCNVISNLDKASK